MLDAQKQRAQEIHKQYQQARAQVQADKNLSNEGKRTRLAELQDNYQRQVDALKAEGRQVVDGERQRLAKSAVAARVKAVETYRQTLGDNVYSTLLMRELETKGSADIIRWHSEAAEGFEKMLVGLYGTMLVEQRLASGEPSRDDYKALEALAQSEPEELRQVQQGLRSVDAAERELVQLDPAAYHGHLADAFGIDARYVTEAVS